jgi:putative multiple sugar transport system substrate-binding protein
MKTTMKMLAASLVLATSGMAVTPMANAADKGAIGISMPTKSSMRWIADGDNMVKVFKERGYKTDLQFADDDIPNQLAQVENMITKGAKVLVIAAIDGTTLSNVLQKAADKGIKVISYDRLIRGTKNIDYYATFDNFQVGVLQAGYIESALKLKEGKGPFNIELFGGSADDNNATSSTTARCRCSNPTSTAASWWCARSRWAWTRSPPCAGTAPWRRRAWTTCSAPTMAMHASMPCCRPMMA